MDPKRVFAKTVRHIRKLFENTRKKTAWKLKNQRLKKIHFHTFRHWFATTLYYKTGNIILVQRKLGHKNIKNTQKYIQIAEELFKDIKEYNCKIASNSEEARKLIEKGYEKMDEFPNGDHLYRRQKLG